MNLLPLALLAVASFAAEPATLTLTRLGGGVMRSYYRAVSRDFSTLAIAGEQGFGVWHLPDGRQIDRIPLPEVRREQDDLLEFRILDISPDGKSVLVSQARRMKNWEHGEFVLYLVNREDKKYKALLKGRMGCHHIGEPNTMLAGMVDCPRVNSAAFSPDGKRVAAWTWGFQDADFAFASGWQPTYGLTVLDLDGKVIKEISARDKIVEKGNSQNGGEDKRVSLPAGLSAGWFSPDGRLLGIAQDDAGCEVKDVMSGKTVSFLDSCIRRTGYLEFMRDGKIKAWRDNEPRPNTKTGTYTYWDAETGRRLVELVVPAGAADAWGGERHFTVGGEPTTLVIRDAAGAILARSSATPEGMKYGFPSGGFFVSPDGSNMLLTFGDDFGAYRLNLDGPGAPAVAKADAPPAAAKVDVDAVPAASGKADADSYAVVIGVEKYRQAGIPAVDYAARDAKTMSAYLTGAMGFDPKNVVLLTDERASKTDLEKHLGTWLKNRVGPKSRVFVYYAGHGAPNPATGAGYLMPYEADPSYLDDTAYPLSKLYASLDALPTKDVTVVLDACFSGQGPRSLIAKGARPLVASVAQKGPKRAAVIAAASSSQISLSDAEAKHGLLTYYLLEGLHGAADADGDGKITPQEAFDYARPAVERAARLQNQEQTPTATESLKADARPWVTLKK